MNPPTLSLMLLAASTTVLATDPRVDSWITDRSGRYARIYPDNAAQSAGAAVATWSNGAQTQALPAYGGVQGIQSSSAWVYIRTTGLALHVMGPWQNGTFPNLPTNRKALYRIPRVPAEALVPTLTGLGVIGYFVDGVAMFDSRDGFAWTGAAESPMGTGYWNREAYVNEGATFDPGYAHQENTGTHHYHANPVALRHLLGDHVDFVAGTRTYRESAGPADRHSPILGWVRDGYPVYGPYGYDVADDAASGVRRMRSGFQLRNGDRGTDNLAVTGRSTLPDWARRLYGVSASQAGPAVSGQYPLGRYMEDNAYLGDLTDPSTGNPYRMGVDFDLDEANGRWCVTPEFPEGVYAYFVSILADGTPAYPYNIGRAYHGAPTGDAVTGITEEVVTHFTGGAETPAVLQVRSAGAGEVTLVWNAVEGGVYQVESSADLDAWEVTANGVTTGDEGIAVSEPAGSDVGLYRVRLSSVAEFDPATGTPTNGGGGGGMGGPALDRVTPSTGARGSQVVVTLTLGANPPPTNVQPTAARLGTLEGTQVQRTDASTVTARFDIPSGAATGPVTASVVFPGPPGVGDVTFSLAGGFTVE